MNRTDTTPHPPETVDDRTSIDLEIDGMTCASCAARIERKLSRLDGVSASVNYATNRALVLAPAGISAQDLVKTVEQAGYGASVHRPDAPPPPDPAKAIRRRLVVALALAVPVIVVSMVPALQFPAWQWVVLALTTPIVTWCAWDFHRSALVNARHGATTMDTLISLGTTAAYAWSVYAMVAGEAGRIGLKHSFELTLTRHHAAMNIYFEAAAGIIAFILLGRWFEARSRRDAGAAIRSMMALGATEVTVLRGGVEHRVAPDSLAVGDLFVVRPGEKVATDGVVVEGRSAVDAALMTGESVPVEVGPDSPVIGATINTIGRLVVRATRVGSDTQLAQLARLVEQAQTGKAPVQRLADRIAGIFVPIVLALAAATAIGWLLAGESLGYALTTAVAVLIIACPCALGLATPTALLVGTGRGAQLGLIISGPEVLESSRRVDTIVLDKTGTLTTGVMTVVSSSSVDQASDTDRRLQVEQPGPGNAVGSVATAHDAGYAAAGRATQRAANLAIDPLLSAGHEKVSGQVEPHGTPPPQTASSAPEPDAFILAAAAVEQGSEHPISRAISALAPDVPVAHDTHIIPGRGVIGTVHGREVAVGNAALMRDRHLAVPEALATALQSSVDAGASTVLVGWEGSVRGVFGVADALRPTAAAAVEAYRDLGLTPILLSGDHRLAAERVAHAVGITQVVAEVTPGDKLREVRRLQSEGRTVAMVGDGVNDAAALAQADLGIAMGSGTDAAIAASDLTLMHSDPLAAADAIRLSRATLRTIRVNLFWAFAYNVAALPVAALGFLNPMVAGAAMAFSSVFVVSNSLRLRRFQPLDAR